MGGVNYNKTNEDRRGDLSGYHGSPRTRDFSQVTREDVSDLSRKYYHQLFDGKYYKTKFAIGFEVEKLESPENFEEFPLFKGYETDSSLSSSPYANNPMEAITNILPLVPNSNLKNKVMDMMVEASEILDLPSDRFCGGHITLSAKGYSGSELKAALRPFSGLVYALYKKRLRNTYAGDDIFLNETGEGRGVICAKDNCAEFRLPSAVPSTNAMQRRYSLFFELMDFAINKPNARFSSFLGKCRPILMRMYSNNRQKVEEVMELAVEFQTMLNQGRVSRRILDYVPRIREVDGGYRFNGRYGAWLDREGNRRPLRLPRDYQLGSEMAGRYT